MLGVCHWCDVSHLLPDCRCWCPRPLSDIPKPCRCSLPSLLAGNWCYCPTERNRAEQRVNNMYINSKLHFIFDCWTLSRCQPDINSNTASHWPFTLWHCIGLYYRTGGRRVRENLCFQVIPWETPQHFCGICIHLSFICKWDVMSQSMTLCFTNNHIIISWVIVHFYIDIERSLSTPQCLCPFGRTCPLSVFGCWVNCSWKQTRTVRTQSDSAFSSSLKLNPGTHTESSKLPSLCSSCGKTQRDAYFFYCIQTALLLPLGGQRSNAGTRLMQICLAHEHFCRLPKIISDSCPFLRPSLSLSQAVPQRSEKMMQRWWCIKQAKTLQHFSHILITVVWCLQLTCSQWLSGCCKELHCITHTNTTTWRDRAEDSAWITLLCGRF